VTVILILLLASAALGLLTGLLYRIWALGTLSVLIAFLSALALQLYGFGFSESMAVSVLCLVVCQLAYVLASLGSLERAHSSQDEIDGSASREGEKNVRDENR